MTSLPLCGVHYWIYVVKFMRKYLGGTLDCQRYETNWTIGHVNSIPSMQFCTGIPRHTQSKLCCVSLTE